jgi:UV DNA damage endonuclease
MNHLAMPLSRLGFAVKILGQPGLKTNDARRWQKQPHLRTSCEYLHPIFDYLEKQRIEMYRMSSDLAPYVTHPDMPQFHGQVKEAAAELRALGKRASERGLRLSFHPSQYTILNSADPELNRKSALDIESQSSILDTMGAGPEACVVVHVGGVYGDKASAMDRWAATYATLPEASRRRLVLENDDISYSAANVLALHERTGVPLVFDSHHFCCNNPEGLDLAKTARKFLATWPSGVRPKMHVSTPRTEMRELKRRNRATKKLETVLLPPLWTGHADYTDPFVFIDLMRKLPPKAEVDIMLEAKAKDLALRRLRVDLQRYAADLAAARFGLHAQPLSSELEEIVISEPSASEAAALA